MRKIAIALSKGGVGKTTTAVNLAAGLARMGANVLLIDLDTQDQAGEALGHPLEIGLADIIQENIKPHDAIYEIRERLWLLAGGTSLAGVKRLIARQDSGVEKLLAKALKPLDKSFDFAIIDFPPAWDSLSIAGLFYSSEVLAPVALEAMAIKGLLQFAKRIEDIREYHPSLRLRYVLPTFLDRRVAKSQEILTQLEAVYQDLLCAPIRYNVRLSEAAGFGQTIFEYAPGSPGAVDYQKLSERIARDGTQKDS